MTYHPTIIERALHSSIPPPDPGVRDSVSVDARFSVRAIDLPYYLALDTLDMDHATG